MIENWREITKRIHASFANSAPLIGGVGSPHEPFFLAFALGGEVGELQNILKKIWNDSAPYMDRRAAIASELADIRIYLEHLSRALGVDLESACQTKAEELCRRWPQHVAPMDDQQRGKP